MNRRLNFGFSPRRLPGRMILAAAVWLMAWSSMAQGVTDGRPSYSEALTLPAGDYRLDLIDAGFPRSFASLNAALLSGATIVASLDMAGSATFTSDGSALTLRVFAQTQAPEVVGTAAVNIVNTTDDSVVFNWLDALEDVQPAGPSVSEAMTFSLPSAQSVTLDLTDFAVPANLAAFDIIVLDANFMEVARLAGPGMATVNLPAGDYELFSAATADSGAAAGNGVFRVGVNAEDGNPIISDLNVVGDDIEVQTVDLPAGEVTVAASDVGFPAALDVLSAVLVGDDASVGVSLMDGTASANVAGGTYQLFVFGSSDDTAGGTYTVNVSQNGATVAETVNVVTPDESMGPRLTETFRVDTAADYALTVTDFRFPAALDALSAVVVGPNGLVTTLAGEGSVTFSAEPGDYQVLIAASGAAGQDGLFGVTVDQVGGAQVLSGTSGTTSGGDSGVISAEAGERVTVTLSDLGFPAEFASLSLAVTRGGETVGFVFGAGSFFFDVTESGDYQYTLLAIPDATAGAGLFDIAVSRAATPPPPAPTPDPPEPTPPTPPSSSGGGGAPGIWFLALLLWPRRVSRA